MAPELELSELEQLVILQMREAMRREHLVLTEALKRAEEMQCRLTSHNRSLDAWNEDLIIELNQHGIDVPDVPGSPYTGNPLTSDYD